MQHGARPVGTFFVVVLFSLALTGTALAQGYPPPTTTPTPTPTGSAPAHTPRRDACAKTGVIVKKNGKEQFKPRSDFERGGKIVIKGGQRCAKPDKRVRASIDLDGESTKIGSAISSDKGAYTISGKIPSGASLGPHPIFVNTGSRSYVTDITVVPAGGSKDAGAGIGGPMIAAWAALAGVLAAFLLNSRRRRRPVVMAARVSEVPMLDTWDFVPVLPGRRKKAAATKKRATAKRKPAAKAKAKPAAKRKPVAKSKSKSKSKPTVAKRPGGSSAPKRKPKN